jgi:TonB-dependent SusC/RagA subfamily outer membrane receptor
LGATLVAAAACTRTLPRQTVHARAPNGYVATADTWRDLHVQHVEELMIGRFPGVRVTQDADGYAVQVRSAVGGAEPLYVLDGTPLPTGARALDAVRPMDVARIEVLRDVSDMARYGARGGNGVVLITTKRR